MIPILGNALHALMLAPLSSVDLVLDDPMPLTGALVVGCAVLGIAGSLCLVEMCRPRRRTVRPAPTLPRGMERGAAAGRRGTVRGGKYGGSLPHETGDVCLPARRHRRHRRVRAALPKETGAVCEMCGTHGAVLCPARLGLGAMFLCSGCRVGMVD